MRVWPEFDENGDLPVGVHEATIAEVVEHFGRANLQRQLVARRLERIYNLALETGHLARFIVFGSFVTAKPEPNDIDVFLLVDDSFDLGQVSGEPATIFHNLAAQAWEGASIFWMCRRSMMAVEEAVVEAWQTKRTESRRGIVEVIADD